MKKGFTLIEILIVVAIIAVLASVVLIGLGPTQRAGRDARRIADLRQVQTGLELYFGRCGYYPGSAVAANQVCPGFTTAANNNWISLQNALTGSSLGISAVPNDPSGSRSYGYLADPSGSRYVLGAMLEDANNSSLRNDIDDSTSIVGGSNVCADTVTAPWYCISL